MCLWLQKSSQHYFQRIVVCFSLKSSQLLFRKASTCENEVPRLKPVHFRRKMLLPGRELAVSRRMKLKIGPYFISRDDSQCDLFFVEEKNQEKTQKTYRHLVYIWRMLKKEDTWGSLAKLHGRLDWFKEKCFINMR